MLELSSVQRQAPQAEKLFIGGGTYSCNPLSMVAGSTTLEILMTRKDEIYPTLEARNKRLCEGLQDAFDAVNIPVIVTRAASLMDIHFLKEKGLTINNPDDLVDNAIMAKKDEFCGRLRNHGVYLIHSSALSIEHSDEDIDKTISIAAKCAQEMAENR